MQEGAELVEERYFYHARALACLLCGTQRSNVPSGASRGVRRGHHILGAVQMDFGEIRLDKLIVFSTMTGDSATIDPGNRRIGIVAFQRWSKNKNRLSIRKVSVR